MPKPGRKPTNKPLTWFSTLLVFSPFGSLRELPAACRHPAVRRELRTVAAGLRQIAAWLSLLLIASFHVRRHIGGRAWRRLHYASFVAFWLAVAHGLLLGTERTTVWANVLYLATTSVVTFLTFYRGLVTEGARSVLVGGDGAQIPPAKSLRAV